jgi:2-polyprenyl-6-methoxyphenol hydroxylase-like FAD-dependent oxidoreductase
LIAGAGPAGPALAQYLKNHHVSFRIVEKACESRLQGYSVSLHFGIPYLAQAMGQDNMDGFEEKTSVLYTDDTGFATVTADGEILIQTRSTPTIVGKGIRANRSRL